MSNKQLSSSKAMFLFITAKMEDLAPDYIM